MILDSNLNSNNRSINNILACYDFFMSPLLYILLVQGQKDRLKPIEILFKQAFKDFHRYLYHHNCNILSEYILLSLENLILFSEVRLVFKIIFMLLLHHWRCFYWLRSEPMSRTCRSALNCGSPLNHKNDHQTLEYAYMHLSLKLAQTFIFCHTVQINVYWATSHVDIHLTVIQISNF